MGILSITDQPPLVQAIFSRDVEEVRSLLSQKENINVLDQERRTPLHAAAYVGDVPILQLLLMSGANVNAKDTLWLTPLHRAAASRNEKVLGLLLAHSADVNARDKLWQTPLHVAAANRATKCAEALAPLLSSLNVADRSGRSALHHAVHSGHLETVNLLLNKGASLNVCDKKERQPLHWAAFLGHLEVLKLLVARGADLGCKDRKGYGLLHTAAASGQIEVVKYLLRMGAEVRVLSMGVGPYGQGVGEVIVCLRWLLEFWDFLGYLSNVNHEIDCADKFGNTPLHVAARYGHELLISTLMTNGADTARRGIHDMFPLHLAVLFGFSDCCRKLLSSAGFDINTPDNLGRTCLHAAASGGNVECLNLLLSSGADLRRRDKFGRTPLHYAAANGSYQCAVTLVTAGAGVNEADCKGCSPLHYAAASDTYRSHDAEEDEPLKESRRKEAFFCLEFLLDNGADPSLRDRQGYTAVHYAAAYGNRQNLELVRVAEGSSVLGYSRWLPAPPLQAYNGHCEALKTLAETLVNLDVRDHKGRTALFLATERGSTECVEVLTAHGASALIKERKRKWTPLHAAAASGHTDSLHLLIDSGERADITDVMDAYGQTPLMLAIMNGHVDCVHLLLEKGSTADAADLRGRTALHRGWDGRLYSRWASILCPGSYWGRTPIHLASACGHTAVLRTLLQAALSTDPLDAGVDYSGYSPMHWASYTGHEDCLELLLEHSPFSYLEGNPFTPLHCAVINNQDSTTEMLLGALGAKIVNSRDAKGRTPLHAAAFADNISGLRMLLQHQAEVNATDHTGRTALMTAAENGQTAAVEFLLYRGKADLTVLDENKNTALHLACSKGHEKCALMILAETQDLGLINATNSALQMPLHIAARNGLASVVQALLSRGATVLAVDEEGGWGPEPPASPGFGVRDILQEVTS
uniref:Ankyrin repeat domain 52 n=1 Tax=Canis lupus familiaris TaxID=9615 RepID=A0A8P0N3C2_CANLF